MSAAGEEWVEKVIELLDNPPDPAQQSLADYKACLRAIRDHVNTLLDADPEDES